MCASTGSCGGAFEKKFATLTRNRIFFLNFAKYFFEEQ